MSSFATETKFFGENPSVVIDDCTFLELGVCSAAAAGGLFLAAAPVVLAVSVAVV
jgi:hypothetical protein